MSIQKTIPSFLAWGLIPLAALTITACSSKTASQTTESDNSGAAQVAQMDHGSMGSPSSPMPMDHGMGNMDLGPADESFDLRFIDGMIPHHEGAVLMAQEALQKSNRPEIKQLAEAIVAAQEQEIAEMKAWRSTWYPNAGDEPMMYSTEMGHMMPMTPEMRASMMMNSDLGAADDQFDLRFINMMIPHHQGALTMAQQAAEKSSRPEIKQLTQNILTSQQQEIDQMEQWRKDWYQQ